MIFISLKGNNSAVQDCLYHSFNGTCVTDHLKNPPKDCNEEDKHHNVQEFVFFLSMGPSYIV